jgi:hypothetical protein
LYPKRLYYHKPMHLNNSDLNLLNYFKVKYFLKREKKIIKFNYFKI